MLKNEKPQSIWRQKINHFNSKFFDVWVDFSMSWTARILLAIILLIYWAISAYGIMQIKVGLTSEKLFLDDSPLLELVRLQTDIIFKEGGQVRIKINKKKRF